jgi:hypothetical protein
MDWGDIRNTDPGLDSDIYENVSGNKGRRLRNGPWHHTIKNFIPDENLAVYDFVFRELRLRLSAKMTFAVGVSMDAIIIGLNSKEGEA